MEGVDNSSNFVLVLSPGYCESSYCVAEVNRALQSGKNIILCHDEGVNVGAALKAKPPEFESIGSESPRPASNSSSLTRRSERSLSIRF